MAERLPEYVVNNAVEGLLEGYECNIYKTESDRVRL